MVSVNEPLKVSSRKKEPKMLSGSKCSWYGCSILTRHGHKAPPVFEEGPNPFRSRMRNMVSPNRSRKGSRAARGDDGGAGRGRRRKQMPSRNGADTGGDPDAKAGRLPPGLPSRENLANRPNRVSR